MIDLSDWTPGVIAIAGLAAFRLWVLISSDTILSPVRDKLPLRVAEFLNCPWCSGFWVGVATFVTVDLWGDGAWVQVSLVVLALSAVVGLVAVATQQKIEGD